MSIKATMSYERSVICIAIVLGVIASSCQANEACDKSQCPGPIKYYKDLQCKPIYKTPESCCPYKYDCDHLEDRLPNKCYINNNVYNIGEHLRNEDTEPCDIGCTCSERQGVAQFRCAIVDCFFHQPGCHLRRRATRCCPEVVCPGKSDERITCTVDGKVYEDGEHFVPKAEPNKTCNCAPGYENKNIEPFCRISSGSCRPEFRHAYEIKNKCVPTYYSQQSPQTDCSVAYRCQNDHDEIIPATVDDSDKIDDMTCEFGTLIMNYGDQLNQATDYSSVCMNCTCEVGPIPTCRRLPDDACDITKHPKFDNF